MKRYYWIIVLVFLSCGTDDFPNGIYDYQVERLLSNDASKQWELISFESNTATFFPEVCSDSTLLVFESKSDSLDVFKLGKDENCALYDTISREGRADASSYIRQLFTGSLVFRNKVWIINRITSDNLVVIEESGIRLTYRATGR